MNLSEDTVDLIALVFILFGLVVAIVAGAKNLVSGFLPAERASVPKPGKLEKLLSPQLKAFVASLPRPAGDPLARRFEPVTRESLPYYANHGYVNALVPLWKSRDRYALATRSWARRKKERTEFVLAGANPDDEWDVRALTEQGFFADTVIDLLQSGGPVAEVSRALGFRHLDETQAWFVKWSSTDWTKPVDEDDEDDTPAERSEAERNSFVRGIDEREK
jgi:hypothetical protein